MARPETTARQPLRNVHSAASRHFAALGAAALTALGTAAAAAAHVTLAPPFVESGEPTTLAFETPNERRGHATTSLVVVAPASVELRAADAPTGWTLQLANGTARWSGGRIEGEQTTRFELVVTARSAPGDVSFRATQGYEDGEVVRWQAALTVLPAGASEPPPQHLRRALMAGAVGLAVIAASFLMLRRLRRTRSLQER